MISILILTYNEEIAIQGCLDSVSFSDDVYVLDSFSTDSTVDIVNNSHATLVQRSFDNYATQRNFGLSLPFKYEWLLVLDADERVDSSLLNSLSSFKPNSLFSAYRIQRRDFFFDRWLRFSQVSPYYIRLVKVGQVSYTREINEEVVVNGDTGQLDGFIDHYPFIKGLDRWLDRHNSYSSMEAKLIVSAPKVKFSFFKALFSNNFHERRSHQKKIYYRLPFRPLIKFIFMYFFRLGFLDGLPGLYYCLLISFYEFQISLKQKSFFSSP